MGLHQKTQLRTRKGSTDISVLLRLIITVFIATRIGAVTIDNQLVSTKNDCFERVVLGSMLPVENAFRNVDINSLSECKKLCLDEGDKCKTIAFGISSRGNGTCQLSSMILDKSMNRPPGTMFDPDFDLLERKSECSEVDDLNGDIGQESNAPPPPPFGTLISTNEPSFTPSETTSPFSGQSSGTPNDGFSSPPRPIIPNDRNGRLPGSSSYPDNGYSVSEGGFTRPFEATYSSGQSPYNDGNKDTIYFSHDGFPMYKYPMLYEQNYPAPNGDSLPATYAPNVPTVGDKYKPLLGNGEYFSTSSGTTQSAFGSAYGNGYSYGTPVRYGSTRPQSGQTSPYSPRPTSSYDGTRPSTYHPRPSRPLTDTQYAYRPDPEYSSRPPSNEPPGYGSTPGRPGPSQSPLSGNDYRPIRPYPGDRDRPRPGYGTITEGKYSTTEAPIETYFNPDDYLETRWTVKPGEYGSAGYGDRFSQYDQRVKMVIASIIYNVLQLVNSFTIISRS